MGWLSPYRYDNSPCSYTRWGCKFIWPLKLLMMFLCNSSAPCPHFLLVISRSRMCQRSWFEQRNWTMQSMGTLPSLAKASVIQLNWYSQLTSEYSKTMFISLFISLNLVPQRPHSVTASLCFSSGFDGAWASFASSVCPVPFCAVPSEAACHWRFFCSRRGCYHPATSPQADGRTETEGERFSQRTKKAYSNSVHVLHMQLAINRILHAIHK